MSLIIQPDAHPGRCQNYRSKTYSDAYTETVRCLEYEAQEHVCRFPEFTHQVSGPNDYGVTTLPHPKPWVRPDTTCQR